MNKKRMSILILFACFITGCLFLSADYLIEQGRMNSANHGQAITSNEKTQKQDDIKAATNESSKDTTITEENTPVQIAESEKRSGDMNIDTGENESLSPKQKAAGITEEPWITSDPGYTQIIAGVGQTKSKTHTAASNSLASQGVNSSSELGAQAESAYSSLNDPALEPQLILDCTKVDYLSYIPEMKKDLELNKALSIKNPSISIDAKAAILFDADTMEVLFYKNPVEPVFPASTSKLLTALVALDWCKEEEEVTLGKEIKMIASDSTRAYLSVGQVLSIRNLLEGMLLPSGNDAAYGIAVYVGRKSLQSPGATEEVALQEFIRLMNNKAKTIGVKNSCFKTPDGYDAIGQYTTAYDMGLIGVEAAKNKIIAEITEQSTSRNSFISGEDVTWTNTNKLISRYSGQYYSRAYGLKTGTSTMAGRCLVSAAELDGRTVVSVVMNSTSAGRWEDTIALLKYGLNR